APNTTFPVYNDSLTGGSTCSATGSHNCAVMAIMNATPSGTALLFSGYLGWSKNQDVQSQARSLFIDAPGEIGANPVFPSGDFYVGGRTSDTTVKGTAGAIQTSYNGSGTSPDSAILERYHVNWTRNPPAVTLVARTLLGGPSSTKIEQTVYGIAGMDVSGNTYNGYTCTSATP